MYFLEPTTIEVDGDTYFSGPGASGTVRFIPDPSLDRQLLPALPNGQPIQDGVATTGSTTFTSASQDFNLSRVREGDEVQIKYWPLTGSKVLPDPVPGVAGLTLIYSVDSGPSRTVTFIRDDASLSVPLKEVSRGGIIDQINASFGESVCSLTATNQVQFEADKLIVIDPNGTGTQQILDHIDGTGTALAFHSAGPGTLGTDVQRSNRAPHAGTYEIASISGTTTVLLTSGVSLGADFATHYAGPTFSSQSYEIFRPGAQRLVTSEMSDNEAEAGLYYFDVELVSEGTGDLWNLDAEVQLTAENYRSDGWYLTTEDSNISFTEVEKVSMVISRTVLPDGVDDDPANAIQITGQNLHITYDRAPSVEGVQSFITSEVERVVCSNPLARYLTPYFIRFDLTYTGGSKVEVIRPEVEEHIRLLYPVDTLQSSHLQKIFLDRGATGITNPLDLLAIVHEIDRSVTTRRSQDALGADSRLTTFIPDVLNIVRDV